MQLTTTESLYSIFLKHPLVSTDTRNIIKGSLFFALKGGNFNGNEFASHALDAGSEYAIVDEAKYCINEKYLLVEDGLKALQELAKFHRNRLTIPFIGITGSNGKTTTKELIHAVLSRKFKTLATFGNLNNHIGVPLTLLSITGEHQMAVIEMGANHLKEIEFLCGIASPNFGLITNIGKAHVEGFGSVENIVIGKSELYKHIQNSGGLLFVNGDNAQLMQLSEQINRITYGGRKDNHFTAEFKSADPYVQLELHSLTANPTVKTQIIGKYNFDNCVAAACIGNYFGVAENDILDALEKYVPSNNRSQVMQKGSTTILMDAYNANPSSMEVAITNFAEMKAENKLAILGDMLELGAVSEQEHQRIVNLLSDKAIKAMVIGPLFQQTSAAFNVLKFPDSTSAGEHLKNNKLENSTLLIKGSRGMKLESLLDFI
ncbi:MAG: UDP-N-acetylmuramoyl-tripeptide--D-alanyl-D-alanine ligase [Bacteroidetes bacterium]|nr:UDP-N-acetylmuramoyl-tripeptide--D-alanyl-D-alanine ligase [Bacteroidota bacterium]